MEGEVRLRRKDGTLVTCLTICTPMFSPSGEIARYQGTLTDITHKKEMAERLHTEQEFARRLVTSFPDIITALDRDGRLTFVSPRITEALGYDSMSLMGQPFADLVGDEDRPRFQETIRNLIEGRETYAAIEYRMFAKDGSSRVVLTSACPLGDAGGRITGVVATTHDLTERRRLEQQVIQTEKLAAMGRMVAGVAHEINNPLTVVLGASDLSGARSQDPTVRRQFELIHQEARRTAEIVQSLLSFSRPPSAERSPLNLDELIRRTAQLGDYSMRVNKIKIDVRPATGLLCVRGDAGQLIQVFLNLITNAQQAIREVKESGTIRISTGRALGKVWASFQDDGPGIKHELLPNIFEPFFTTKRPGQGTGLGLSICLAIVRDHDGTIEVRDGPAGGTEFIVTLPDAGAKSVQPEPPVGEAQYAELHGRRILVVDDDQAILDFIQMALSNRQMLVECCHSGEEALAQLASREFDFIVCDMRMPAISAKDFYEQALVRFAQIAPFILVTGDPSPEALEFVKSRDIPLLIKPFRISKLLQKLLGFASAEVKSVS